MHEHLRSSRDGTVAHHSITGKWTIDSLDLNSPKKVQKRIFYLNTYNNAKRQIKIFEKLLTEIKGKIDDSDEEELSDIEISYLEAIEQCESVNSIIDYIENGPSE
ncbi:hypothetical protein [Candidatus Thiodiazotropha sp. CDECU1]|uniref:hypothetical protein n=1 Tax=Candidatus Thiodiazotropha sp. CDECU1 TaxID=3065865 RepID=UPI00292D457E|nr:hypothetical protein [Candidatus Thiodiazotropha sp. CDECU1]